MRDQVLLWLQIKRFSWFLLMSFTFSLNAYANVEFNNYWYAGDAELTSYKIKQARYGELHTGTAVLIYVTEQLLPKEQVKANKTHDENITVLKLNKHKSFLTGIYPYTIMTSVFSPVSAGRHAVKVTNTTQEWCGNTYSQLNNREMFDIRYHSYFEGEADQFLTLEKTHLEDEIWNTIRLKPEALPVGAIEMVPAFEYIRLLHIKTKAYKAVASIKKTATITQYSINYPALKRTLTIEFQNKFPYIIERWKDEYKSGFDSEAERLTSTGERISTIKEKYWELHNNRHRGERKKLGLDPMH